MNKTLTILQERLGTIAALAHCLDRECSGLQNSEAENRIVSITGLLQEQIQHAISIADQMELV